VSLCELFFLLSLAALTVYFLTIILRVACHFSGVPIPAIGRAVFTTGTVTGVSLLVGVMIQWTLVTDQVFSPLLQFFAFVLILLANLALSLGAFRPLLHLRAGQAFSVWLIQTVLTISIGVLGVLLALAVNSLGS
jgi:hypothetical protein